MINIMIIAGGLQVGGAERVAANISRYATTGEFQKLKEMEEKFLRSPRREKIIYYMSNN